jgi:hypothetical protein
MSMSIFFGHHDGTGLTVNKSGQVVYFAERPIAGSLLGALFTGIPLLVCGAVIWLVGMVAMFAVLALLLCGGFALYMRGFNVLALLGYGFTALAVLSVVYVHHEKRKLLKN